MPNLTPYEAEKLKEFGKNYRGWLFHMPSCDVAYKSGMQICNMNCRKYINNFLLTSIRQTRQDEREVIKKEVRQFREIIKEKLLRKARKLDYSDTTEYEEAFNIIDREIKELLTNKETKEETKKITNN